MNNNKGILIYITDDIVSELEALDVVKAYLNEKYPSKTEEVIIFEGNTYYDYLVRCAKRKAGIVFHICAFMY